MGSREKNKLSDQQKQLIIGTMLGDGCLEKNGRFSRLRVQHKFDHKSYVEWKAKVLKPFLLKPPYKVSIVDKRTSKTYSSYKFDTLSSVIFDQYRQLFYNNNKKVISKNISKYLKTNLAFSVWYMDDGFNRKDCKGSYLNTQSFSEKENILLQSIIYKNYRIKSTIHWAGGRPRIYFPSNQARKIRKVIKPHILNCMLYKIP